jgi:hypothetical protein
VVDDHGGRRTPSRHAADGSGPVKD